MPQSNHFPQTEPCVKADRKAHDAAVQSSEADRRKAEADLAQRTALAKDRDTMLRRRESMLAETEEAVATESQQLENAKKSALPQSGLNYAGPTLEAIGRLLTNAPVL